MPIVVDASMTLAMLFHDERTPGVDAAWQRIAVEGGVIPDHFGIEVANAILMAVRRRRFTREDAEGMFGVLDALSLEIDTVSPRAAFRVADDEKLTVYDAAYLEIATRRGVPLASLDQELVVAAHRKGLEILSR